MMNCETCEGTGRIVEGGQWVMCPDCQQTNEDGVTVSTGKKLVGGDDDQKGGRGKKPKNTDNPPPTPGGGVGR